MFRSFPDTLIVYERDLRHFINWVTDKLQDQTLLCELSVISKDIEVGQVRIYLGCEWPRQVAPLDPLRQVNPRYSIVVSRVRKWQHARQHTGATLALKSPRFPLYWFNLALIHMDWPTSFCTANQVSGFVKCCEKWVDEWRQWDEPFRQTHSSCYPIPSIILTFNYSSLCA